MPETSRIKGKVIPIPNFAIPPLKSRDDSDTHRVERMTIQDESREIPIYPDPVYRPPSKPVKPSISMTPGSLLDIDPVLNIDFEDNSPHHDGVISETYPRPDK